jgi:hypothetical protein
MLAVPAIAVRQRERSGASRALRLNVRDVPAAGRPAEFLGGVGKFELDAKASPAHVRSGETFEYRILVKGPAARAMTRAPTLSRFDRLPVGLRIEPPTVETVADPPSRVFRYRVRPLRAGAVVLPPVAIAAFMPETGLYVTKVTPGVPVRIVDVERLDPNALDYLPPSPARGPSYVLWGALAGAVVVLVAGVTTLRRFRARGEPARRLRRLVRRTLIGFAHAHDTADLGRRITDGLIAYLELAAGRPRGALTPDEARRGIARSTTDGNLGARAEALVTLCDRAQYAGHGLPDAELLGAASCFFGDLLRCEESGNGKEREAGLGKPREAVETTLP